MPGDSTRVDRTAEIHVLCAGYTITRDKEFRVASTVTCIRDGDLSVIDDPGLVAQTAAILRPLADLGVDPADITDIVLSHHHPDHTVNIALFPNARVHDHWAIYHADWWTSRPAEGFQECRERDGAGGSSGCALSPPDGVHHEHGQQQHAEAAE